jgi:alpha-L-fucosidase
MLNRREFACGLLTACSWSTSGQQISTPSHAGSLLKLQQEFLDLRFGMFIHLNMATYEQREWGDRKASQKLFNPANINTDQWAEAARSANMTYGCLTTKHHDGFCLWPTATSSPSVKDASVHGDIVRFYTDSFRKFGLKICLYFSILDLRANIRPYQVTRQKIEP